MVKNVHRFHFFSWKVDLTQNTFDSIIFNLSIVFNPLLLQEQRKDVSHNKLYHAVVTEFSRYENKFSEAINLYNTFYHKVVANLFKKGLFNKAFDKFVQTIQDLSLKKDD